MLTTDPAGPTDDQGEPLSFKSLTTPADPSTNANTVDPRQPLQTSFKSLTLREQKLWFNYCNILLGRRFFFFEDWLQSVQPTIQNAILNPKRPFMQLLFSDLTGALYGDLVALLSNLQVPETPVPVQVEEGASILASLLLDVIYSPCRESIVEKMGRWQSKWNGLWDRPGRGAQYEIVFNEELLEPLYPPSMSISTGGNATNTTNTGASTGSNTNTTDTGASTSGNATTNSTSTANTTANHANMINNNNIGTIDSPPSPPKPDWWAAVNTRPAPFDPRLAGLSLRSFTNEQSLTALRNRQFFPALAERANLHQNLADPFGQEAYRDNPTLAARIPPCRLVDPDFIRSIKVESLKTFCRIYALPVTGTKSVLLGRVFAFLNTFDNVKTFSNILRILDGLWYSQNRRNTGVEMQLRQIQPLQIDWLLLPPNTHALPTTAPWLVREELTPPLLLFRFQQHRPPTEHDADNHLSITVHHTLNTNMVLLVYKVRNVNLPDDQLLSMDNLERAPPNTPLRAIVSNNNPNPATQGYRFVVNDMRCMIHSAVELKTTPWERSGPMTVWLWRIRACDQLVVQVVRAVWSPDSFPAPVPVQAPVNPIHSPQYSKPLQLAQLPRLEADSVMASLVALNSSTDVIVDSMCISIKCPISLLTIKTPVRSRHCRHFQCFDWDSYLSVLAPKNPYVTAFKCPICFKECMIANLVIDGYFERILKEVKELFNDSIDDVSVMINGSTGSFNISAVKCEEEADAGDGDEHLHTCQDGSTPVEGKRPRVLIDDSEDDLEDIQETARRIPPGSSWMNPIILD